jgi:protein-disulfide isomerase
LLLLCLGCSAQSAAPSEVNRRIERLVRTNYNVAANVEVRISDRRPSPEFSGYDLVTVTLSRGEKSNNFEFLLSKDGKKLLRMVPVTDPMEKIDLAGRPVRGNPNAKVTIVNYDDYQCPFCARNHTALMSDVLQSYGDRVRIIYKDYPLKEIHPWARRAAIDANCLALSNNDAYWDFADYVHANQKEISGADKEKPRPLPEQFAALDKAAEDAARKRNADLPKLQACLKAQPDASLNASVAEAESLGVSATPTMYIDGQKLDGLVAADELHKIIDRALVDAGVTKPAAASAQAPGPAAPVNPNH